MSGQAQSCRTSVSVPLLCKGPSRDVDGQGTASLSLKYHFWIKVSSVVPFDRLLWKVLVPPANYAIHHDLCNDTRTDIFIQTCYFNLNNAVLCWHESTGQVSTFILVSHNKLWYAMSKGTMQGFHHMRISYPMMALLRSQLYPRPAEIKSSCKGFM